MSEALGSTIPALERHAVSVSLPTWKDVVDYELGEKRVIGSMNSGYPRFFWHQDVQKLCRIIETEYGSQNHSERCILFPIGSSVEECLNFLSSRTPPVKSRSLPIDIEKRIRLYAVFVAEDDFGRIKEFWQHTGEGISSRFAARCLKLLKDKEEATGKERRRSQDTPSSPTSTASRSWKSRYQNKAISPIFTPSPPTSPTTSSPVLQSKSTQEELDEDADFYVEERYGRNLPTNLGEEAKLTVRKRIAGVLGDQLEETSLRNGLTEDDVYLYPTGMTAIFRAHVMVREERRAKGKEDAKSVVFGFVYGDTLKLMEKFGPGCHFFPSGQEEDLNALERLCEKEEIVALYCEFPSNPLLKSSDLRRLRELADRFGFALVVDDTVGNFWNIDVLSMADVVVSSLTKIFSGDCNVMGGSLILNPTSQLYGTLKRSIEATYTDAYFSEDAIYMERNSRDFIKRIKKINRNAEMLCDFFESSRLHPRTQKQVIKLVSYPKFATPQNYARCLRNQSTSEENSTVDKPGYGGLFSLTFMSVNAAAAFYDNMPFSKGPSLGTNFTLACPYTVLVHFNELEWAKNYGVELALVRVSVGMEDEATLRNGFEKALKAAEEAAE
ncbi:PLP-dependent transferase [Atractiella rhizophila]|nr:PLP-dependent transferase [Atractiella rhizophila]